MYNINIYNKIHMEKQRWEMERELEVSQALFQFISAVHPSHIPILVVHEITIYPYN